MANVISLRDISPELKHEVLSRWWHETKQWPSKKRWLKMTDDEKWLALALAECSPTGFIADMAARVALFRAGLNYGLIEWVPGRVG
jgi:hypothetical protein